MSISEIDILQTEQIEDLQDDVQELRDKLNLIVTDITHATNGLTAKLNQAIEDADDLNEVLNAGYSVASGGGSNTSIGILERLDELFEELEAHKYTRTGGTGGTGYSGYLNTHPPDSSAGTTINSYTPVTSGLSGTAQGNGNPRSAHTSVVQSVTAGAPVYVAGAESMVTLKSKGELRARKMARTLVKKTR